jgi:hypothetical protein
MKKQIKLLLPLLFIFSIANAQDSPTELGNIVFNAFKENKLELLFENRIKENQLDSFFIWLGNDIKAESYITYKSKYTKIKERYIDTCRAIQNEYTNGKFSWKKAKLISINYKPSTSLDTAFNSIAPKGETTMLQLNVKSKSKKYTFILDIIQAMDNKWHLGNFIMRLNGGKRNPKSEKP